MNPQQGVCGNLGRCAYWRKRNKQSSGNSKQTGEKWHGV
jgi:hypothetical protein